MKTYKTYINEQVEDPFWNHKLRMKKGYRPKYKSGLIAIRFIDDQVPINAKFKDVDDKGKYRVNYQELFSFDKDHQSDFVKYFLNKYDLKMSDYRSQSSDYHIYFKCKPGEEQEKMKEVAKDEIVKDVDYVDARGVESIEELESISRVLLELIDEYTDVDDLTMRREIQKIIMRLHELI